MRDWLIPLVCSIDDDDDDDTAIALALFTSLNASSLVRSRISLTFEPSLP